MTKPSKILPRSVKVYLILLIISTGVILYGTLFPSNYSIPSQFPGFDKLVHFLMFGFWSFFYGVIRFLKGKYSFTPILLVGGFFGILIEILQHFLPTGRSPELMDVIADLSGVALALLFLYVLSKKIPEFSRSSPSS